MPCYGLAESSVALTFPPIDRRPVIDTIRRDTFEQEGRAVPAAPGERAVLRFVANGAALPGHEVRIVDDQNQDVPERVQGRVLFRGPSKTSRLLPQPGSDGGSDHRWLDGLGRSGLPGRWRDLRHRPSQRLHHQGRPQHHPAGSRDGRRRSARACAAAAWRRSAASIQRAAPSGWWWSPRRARRGYGGTRAHRGRDRRSRGREMRAAAGPCRAGAAAQRAENIERQDPPQRNAHAVRDKARCGGRRDRRDAGRAPVARQPRPVAATRRRKQAAGGAGRGLRSAWLWTVAIVAGHVVARGAQPPGDGARRGGGGRVPARLSRRVELRSGAELVRPITSRRCSWRIVPARTIWWRWPPRLPSRCFRRTTARAAPCRRRCSSCLRLCPASGGYLRRSAGRHPARTHRAGAAFRRAVVVFADVPIGTPPARSRFRLEAIQAARRSMLRSTPFYLDAARRAALPGTALGITVGAGCRGRRRITVDRDRSAQIADGEEMRRGGARSWRSVGLA